MTTQKQCSTRVDSLYELLQKNKFVRVLEAHNGLSGLIVENSDFDAIWESSLTDSASKGLPDIELVSMDSRMETIRQIIDVTTKPIIVDGDTGGQIDHFPYWVNKMEKAGVSAVIIEDKAFPKRNSLDESAQHQLEEVDIFAKKIEAGVKAKMNDKFMIIARLESLIAQHSVYEALIRAEAFLKAGVDGIMIHSKEKISATEVFEFARRFKMMSKKPLVCVPTTYNDIFEQQLQEAGFNIVIHANHLLRASFKAMEKAAEKISVNHRSKELDDDISSVKEIFNIVGYDKL